MLPCVGPINKPSKKVTFYEIARLKEGEEIRGPHSECGYYFIRRKFDAINLYRREIYKDGSFRDLFESHIFFELE